jgi:hypothetical protein
MADPAATGWGWWRERRLPAGPLHLDSELDRLRQALIALD